jgi:hypothetical protein
MPFCEKCGREYREGAIFCKSCGAPCDEEDTQLPAPKETMVAPHKQPVLSPQPGPSAPTFARVHDDSRLASSRLACPTCHSNDRVEKVTSVVSSALSSSVSTGRVAGGAYSHQRGAHGTMTIGGGRISTSGESMTFLGERLMPPKEPRVSRWPWVGIAGMCVLFALSAAVPGVFRIIPVAAGLVFLGWDSMRTGARYNKAREQAQLLWERQRENYRNLLYCHRCDQVFYDGDAVGLPPERMHELLLRR